MEQPEMQLPLGKCAFEHPHTRAGWTAARRKTRRSLALWGVLWLALFVALSLLGAQGHLGDGKARQNVMGGVPVVTLLVYLVFAYRRISSLRCLGRMRRVLEAHPWRPIPAARAAGGKDVLGVAVQLRRPEPAPGDAGDGDGWTAARTARNPLERRRWPAAMEHGAWYAGDLEGPGVLALPGGDELMSVEPRRDYR